MEQEGVLAGGSAVEDRAPVQRLGLGGLGGRTPERFRTARNQTVLCPDSSGEGFEEALTDHRTAMRVARSVRSK